MVKSRRRREKYLSVFDQYFLADFWIDLMALWLILDFLTDVFRFCHLAYYLDAMC